MTKNVAAVNDANHDGDEPVGMASDLRERCERVRRALAKSGPQDTRARYQIGELVKDAKEDPEKYGKKAVQQIAAFLGYDEKTLYRYAPVAETWSSDELNELLARPSTTGIPISFSHLLKIATVTNKRQRQKYINQVLEEGLSVRELKRRMKPERAVNEDEPEIDAARALRSLSSASETLLVRVRKWEETVLPALDGTPPSPEIREHYKKALKKQRELIAGLERVAEKLGSLMGESPASRERSTLESNEDEDENTDSDKEEEVPAHDGTHAEEEEAEEEQAEQEEEADEDTRARTV